MIKALLIYNPVAGRKKLCPATDKAFNILHKKYELDIYATEKEKSVVDIIKEKKANEYDVIFCCGGDGTLNEVINGVIKNKLDTPIGYIPCGSANDFAKTLHIPMHAPEAIKALADGDVAFVDVGLFNKTAYFSYAASFGLLSKVSYDTPLEEKNKLGYFAYVWRGLKEAMHMGSAPAYEAEILLPEGRKIHGQYIFGLICNSTSVGGVLKLPASAVDIQDGLFEGLFVRKPHSDDEWMVLIDDILHKRLENNPLIDFFHASAIKIKLPKLDWSLDGEKKEGEEEMVIENQHRLIKMILPQRGEDVKGNIK